MWEDYVQWYKMWETRKAILFLNTERLFKGAFNEKEENPITQHLPTLL